MKPRKLWSSLVVVGAGPVSDGINFFSGGRGAVVGDLVAEEFDGGAEEFAFGLLGVQVMFAQRVEDGAQVVDVGLGVLGIDEDVVQVHNDEFVEEGA